MTAASPRPDTGTRIYLGCAVAFLSVFLVVGLLAVVAALAGRSPNPGPAVAIGLAFVLVPAGGLLLVRWVWRQAALREQRRQMAPDQPWAWKQDVSARVVKGTSPTATVVFWVVFASFWLGITALITFVARDQIRREAGLGVFLAVFWAAGLFLAGMGARAILHARRFGSSSLALDAAPGRLGGWISGVVRAPLALRGAETQLDVSCIETTRSPQGASNSNTSTWVRWRTTKLLDGTRFAVRGDHVEIPFAVRLPTNEEVAAEYNDNALSRVLGQATIDLVGRDMDWYVGVKARVPGVDYSDRYAVPVAPAEAAPTPEAAVPPREMPELAGERLAQRLPGRLERDRGADVFVFPVKASWIVWILALAGVAVLPAFADAAVLARVPPEVVKGGAIVCGALAALSFIGLMLDTRRIEVSPEAVRIRRGILNVGFHRTIPRSEVAKVEEEPSRSEPPTYSVNIRLRDGKSVWAALALREPDQAAALAARLRQILQLG